MTPDALARLHARCFSAPRPWSAAEFGTLLSGPGVFVLGDAQGILLGRALAGEAELLTLAVDPAARRRGLARRLLAAFEEEARARGADDAFLEVAAGNAAALSLYAGAGYVRAGRRRNYYQQPDGTPDDALVLRKPLKRV